MYAIIKSGAKQYKVKEGEIILLEKLNLNIGEKIKFDVILMGQDISGKIIIGTPTINGSEVTGEIIEQNRHKKVKIIKFRRRKQSIKHQGHRQYFTAVKILSISF